MEVSSSAKNGKGDMYANKCVGKKVIAPKLATKKSKRIADAIENRLKKYAECSKAEIMKEHIEPEVIAPFDLNQVLLNMYSFCDKAPTAQMSKYMESRILKTVRAPKLEQKYPDIVPQAMVDVRNDYIIITHKTGIFNKIKTVKEESDYVPNTYPSVSGTKTERQAVFTWTQRKLKSRFILMYPLIRHVFEECVVSLPNVAINFKRFRTDYPATISGLRELFKEEMIYCRYFIRTFYKTVILMVINDGYRGIDRKNIARYLKACNGLLSIHLTRLIVNTVENMRSATSNEDTIPYLNLSITLDSNGRLQLDPNPDDLVEFYLDMMNIIANVTNNLTTLECYVVASNERKFIPIFVTKEYLDEASAAVEKNLREKLNPVLRHIDQVESEFNNICPGASPSLQNATTDSMSFEAGCEKMTFYREYIENMRGRVSNLYYPIGKLQQEDCLDNLIVSVEKNMNSTFESLCKIHMRKNERICEQFEMIARKAMEIPNSAKQLMDIGEYMLWAQTVLLTGLKAEITESLKMTTDLIEMANLSQEHMDLIKTTVNWVANIVPILEYYATMYEQKKFELEEAIVKAKNKVNTDLQELKPYLSITNDMKNSEYVNDHIRLLKPFIVKLNQLCKMIQWIWGEEEAFKFPFSNYVELENIRAHVITFHHLLKVFSNWIRSRGAWLYGPFEFLDFSVVESRVEETFKETTKMKREYTRMQSGRPDPYSPIKMDVGLYDEQFLPAPLKLCNSLLAQVKEFRPTLNLMGILCCDALLRRHWEEMSEVAGFDISPDASSTLQKYVEMNLQADVDKYEIISTTAIKERQLKINLEKMIAECAELLFKTSIYKDTGLSVLTQLDDIQAVLDEHTIKTLSIRGSIFVKPYQTEVRAWYEKITRVNKTVEEFGKVQCDWLYLLPIFSSKDIVEQMPEEGDLFQEVNNIYVGYMKVVERDPRVLETAGAPGIYEQLHYCTELLERINDGVVKYLERKRIFFPRFFFLSNDEMLEILSETKDPLRVQPHLRKCFEAINKLEFDEHLVIHGMHSQETEYIKFVSMISTEEAKGSVEKWLVQVEEQMVKSVRDEIGKSWSSYKAHPRTEWVLKWPGQVILAVSQVFWTAEVHRCLDSLVSNAVRQYSDALKTQLQDIVALIRSPKLTNLSRITIKALIVIDVHAKDVVQELADLNLRSANEFKWQAQLRYYWTDEMLVRLINAEVKYAYEYLGNTDRLVITPLTDRCYRTLIGAYHLHLNGAPEGPAGTGKTETTKDLAKALAVQCVVFNCSDGLDYKAMGKFFKGLAASGAWVCFDEFNRIEIEVLSVVAQQILSIILAVRANLDKFIFEGTELKLNPCCYVCITMNPGYAGRTELPDNLKVLFRTVAMMVPDYAMIGEISLYSYGFGDARNLSVKIVTTYRLCSEQLSSQNHYDYGMRAVKSVLSACGNNKRQFPDENEDILLLRALIDVNLPKFLSHDVPLFEGIISDLFPGVVLPQAVYTDFINAAKISCSRRKLQPQDSFITKIIQTYEMMIVRHGFMVVGEPFAGKTSTLKVLADTLTIMHSKGLPQEIVRYQIINPKSVTIGQLYGQFDPISYEWFDGVVATTFRKFVVDSTPDRKWIIFDGPVDAVWIENMNSALDDNKKLCLMSGEVMAMTGEMSLIFEVMDLAQASPATVRVIIFITFKSINIKLT